MPRGLWVCCSAVVAPLFVAPLFAAASFAAVLPSVGQPVARDLCTPVDPELAELSGLATDGRRWFAVSDGGTSLRVVVLDPADCSVLEKITARVNPYDVEDLALATDGALWLADTGDNDLDRGTVALHRLTRDGDASLYRLTYPDGPHDVEALLLDHADVPYLVTKELGAARVYRPIDGLAEPGPTALEQVATLQIKPTDTPGGPVGRTGSMLVTGAAVSADGQLVALRTYTDAYLFPAPGGDVVAALARSPTRIPLPDEPQGEALALAPDGTLLSGSELADEDQVPIRGVAGAAALIGPVGSAPREVADAFPGSADPAPGSADPAPDLGAETGDGGLTRWQAAVVAGGVVGLLALLAARRRARNR
ncbi:MAG: hypothetical protein ACT4NY_28730 [Pseudonocardiales bacterium]